MTTEECPACGETHEQDNCPEAHARAIAADKARARYMPTHDFEGAILGDQEDYRA